MCGVVKNWILWSFRDIKLCLSKICWIFFDWRNKGGETKWFWSFPKVIWESGVNPQPIFFAARKEKYLLFYSLDQLKTKFVKLHSNI